jgi:hypothetical protein
VKKIPIRNALILYVNGESAEQVAMAIDSIRRQSLIPWFVRIIIGPESYNHILNSPVVVQAVDNLKEFCPNVIEWQMNRVIDRQQALDIGYEKLRQYFPDIDVYSIMDADVVLMDGALKNLTDPFYDGKVAASRGTYKDLVSDHLLWDEFVFRFFPRYSRSRNKLVAYRNC